LHKAAKGLHKGHFHIPAGMVVREEAVCHRGACFLRKKDFDTLGIGNSRGGGYHGSWGGMVQAQEGG